MQEDEKMDRFIEGLKYDIKVEVLKFQVDNFDECAKVALNIDSVIWRAQKGGPSDRDSSVPYSRNDPMEIGNLQRAHAI